MDYLLLLQNFRNDTLNAILMTVTEFIASPVVYVGLAILYWCFNKSAAYFIAMNISVGNMVNQALKNTFCIYRPWIKNNMIKPVPAAMETATGYSFPSGHTQVATSEFISIAVWQRKRKWLVAVCSIITLLVMFTRNYLGVHTPQDVVVSLFMTLIVIFLNGRILSWVDSQKNRDWIVFGIGMTVSCMFLAYVTLKPYPIDYTANGNILVDPKEMITDCYSAAGCVFGFLIGWICERKLLNFTTDVPKSTRIVRSIIGTAILLAFVVLAMEPIKSIHPYWGNLLFFAIAFIFILFIYPLLFTLWEKKSQRI